MSLLRRTPLRRLVAALLAVMGVLVALLFALASMQLHASRAQTDAENRRAASFLIADGLRQSSNDLTNMVRLYVATGQPKYRDFYEEILAVRAGTAPRPAGYDSSFWDRVLAEGKGFVRYGRPQSLIAQMRAEAFAPAEFRALNTALDTSNGLAELEQRVMRAVAPRIRQGVDASYPRDVAPEYRLLVDGDYLAEKGRIMRAIRDFTQRVETRTQASVDDAARANRRLAVAEIAVIGLIAVSGIAAMVLLSRAALRPLAELLASTRKVAGGDYAERASIVGTSDLEELAGAFNEMAASVESDIAARDAAEHEAVVAREAAERASQAKSTFLAAMTHELRTPMIGVTGMLEVLAHTDLTRHQRGMIATAENSARSLLQIIGDVLDFSKIEADKLELAPTTFDVRAVVAAAADTFVHAASVKGLLLTWDVDERLAAAHVGDPLRMRQIVTNLVSNAVKFTEVGGVEVVAGLAGPAGGPVESLVITVRDTGIGVSPEQQQRLFDAFSQADASTTRQFGGTGLGLVICRQLARLMGGDVTMESRLGAGTTMRLEVPLPVGDPGELGGSRPALPGTFSGSRAKPSRAVAEEEGSVVLLAEDHPVNRTVIIQQLDRVGFHVDVAEDGEEAFERFVSGRYGLVLTDLNMPRMDGYELAQAIRRHEQQQPGRPRTPVLALSANVMQGEPERTRKVGMDDFLSKPTTIPFLAGKLRRWMPHLVWPEAGGSEASVLAGPADEGALDLAALDLLTGGDELRGRAVLDDFIATTRGDLAALAAALDAADAVAAGRSAHRIKGAALTVGARPMVRLAAQLEEATAAGSQPDWAALTVLAERLGAALEQTAAVV